MGAPYTLANESPTPSTQAGGSVRWLLPFNLAPRAMATEQRAQRIAGGFAAPADFAALHADRIEAVCRMQAAEGRELTRVWEIGHELKEVRLRLAAVPGPDHSPSLVRIPTVALGPRPHPHPALGPNLAQTRAALRSALEGQAEERRRCGETGALMVQQRELAKRGARVEHRRPDPVACRSPQILAA